MTSLRASLFWVVSRVAQATYGRFPIFGPIRGALAILRHGDAFVVIERNDGRGLGFPGGISHFRELPEKTVQREVFEETGLRVVSLSFQFNFHHPVPFPNHTYVFEATFEGQMRDSWEGKARLATLVELQKNIVPQQVPVVEYLLAQAAGSRPL